MWDTHERECFQAFHTVAVKRQNKPIIKHNTLFLYQKQEVEHYSVYQKFLFKSISKNIVNK